MACLVPRNGEETREGGSAAGPLSKAEGGRRGAVTCPLYDSPAWRAGGARVAADVFQGASDRDGHRLRNAALRSGAMLGASAQLRVAQTLGRREAANDRKTAAGRNASRARTCDPPDAARSQIIAPDAASDAAAAAGAKGAVFRRKMPMASTDAVTCGQFGVESVRNAVMHESEPTASAGRVCFSNSCYAICFAGGDAVCAETPRAWSVRPLFSRNGAAMATDRIRRHAACNVAASVVTLERTLGPGYRSIIVQGCGNRRRGDGVG